MMKNEYKKGWNSCKILSRIVMMMMTMMVTSINALSMTSPTVWKTPLISTLRSQSSQGIISIAPSSSSLKPKLETLSSSSLIVDTTSSSSSSIIPTVTRMSPPPSMMEKNKKFGWMMEWKWVGLMVILVSSTTIFVSTGVVTPTATTTTATAAMATPALIRIGNRFSKVLMSSVRKILWMEVWMYLSNTIFTPIMNIIMKNDDDSSSSGIGGGIALEQYLPKWLRSGLQKLFLKELERKLETTIVSLWKKFRTSFLSSSSTATETETNQ